MKNATPKLIPQIEIIRAEDPAQLQDKINAALMAHPNYTDLRIEEASAIIQFNLEIQPPKPADLLTGPAQTADIDHSLTLCPEDATAQRVVVELAVQHPGDDRYCCECDNYDWGKGCPYRDGIVKLLDPACEMFDLRIGYDMPDVESKAPDSRAQKRWEEQREPQAKFYKELHDILQTGIHHRKLYSFETPDNDLLGNKSMLPEEIAMIVYGTRIQLTEDQIIEIAKEYNAWELWTLEDPIFIGGDPDSITWSMTDCIWQRPEPNQNAVYELH